MFRFAYGKRQFSMSASEELRAAAAVYRARAAPGDATRADLLEEVAQNAAARERMWQLAEYIPQEQTQLAECWWRDELAIARALRPDSE
jgi:hypothetical protein